MKWQGWLAAISKAWSVHALAETGLLASAPRGKSDLQAHNQANICTPAKIAAGGKGESLGGGAGQALRCDKKLLLLRRTQHSR